MKTKTASGIILWYMKSFKFDGWASFWNTIYLAPGHENNQGLIRHEAKHIEQINRDGRILFTVKYLYWLAAKGYWNNPYEIEARQAQFNKNTRL